MNQGLAEQTGARAAGDWTTKLYELSEKCLMNGPAMPGHLESEATGGKADLMDTSTLDLISPSQKDFFGIRIDGPYGAPAQDFKKYKTVLLMVRLAAREQSIMLGALENVFRPVFMVCRAPTLGQHLLQVCCDSFSTSSMLQSARTANA